MASTTLRAQKTALRKAMRGVLAGLSQEQIQAQSRQITRTLLALPEFEQSTNVSCFLNMPAAEVDTSAVVAAIIGAGKNLFVPKTTDKERGTMDLLQIFGEADLRALPRGLWGIREPEDEYEGRKRPTALGGTSEPLDLIVMPGVAFDRSLSRLGYGKGYYDRFLATYATMLQAREGQPHHGDGRLVLRPKLVALALREQILEGGQVPVGETDWKVDVIIGPDGIVA